MPVAIIVELSICGGNAVPLYEGMTVCCTVDCCMLAAITVELSDCGAV